VGGVISKKPSDFFGFFLWGLEYLWAFSGCVVWEVTAHALRRVHRLAPAPAIVGLCLLVTKECKRLSLFTLYPTTNVYN